MSDAAADRLTGLFQAHAPRVLAYLLNRGAGDAAPDLLSDVFATAWGRLDEVPDPALAWLLGVARHKLAHHWRSTARRADLHTRVQMASWSAEGGGAASGAGDAADAVVERAAVLAALAALAPEDREVLLLVGWDGLSTTEAAASLGCTVGAFGVRLHRARRRLGRLLDAAESAPDPGSTPHPQRPSAPAVHTVIRQES